MIANNFDEKDDGLVSSKNLKFRCPVFSNLYGCEEGPTILNNNPRRGFLRLGLDYLPNDNIYCYRKFQLRCTFDAVHTGRVANNDRLQIINQFEQEMEDLLEKCDAPSMVRQLHEVGPNRINGFIIYLISKMERDENGEKHTYLHPGIFPEIVRIVEGTLYQLPGYVETVRLETFKIVGDNGIDHDSRRLKRNLFSESGENELFLEEIETEIQNATAEMNH